MSLTPIEKQFHDGGGRHLVLNGREVDHDSKWELFVRGVMTTMLN